LRASRSVTQVLKGAIQRIRLYLRIRCDQAPCRVSAHPGDDPRAKGCATWHTLVTRLWRGSAHLGRNTKGAALSFPNDNRPPV
jgi:hypothetical protein